MARTRQPGAQRQQAYHATVQMEGPAPPTGDELELDLDHLLASLNAHTDDCDDLLADHMLTGCEETHMWHIVLYFILFTVPGTHSAWGAVPLNVISV